jgi:hypothetical protein
MNPRDSPRDSVPAALIEGVETVLQNNGATLEQTGGEMLPLGGHCITTKKQTPKILTLVRAKRDLLQN